MLWLGRKRDVQRPQLCVEGVGKEVEHVRD